jgi:hypothetical protein
VAVGSRAHLEAAAVAKRRWYRNVLMHGFHLVVLVVTGGAVRDTQCGFKARTFKPFCLTHGMVWLPPGVGGGEPVRLQGVL